MKGDLANASTYELVSQIVQEPSWTSAKRSIPLLCGGQSNTNQDDKSLKRTLNNKIDFCLRSGIMFSLDEEVMKGFAILIHTILDRFLSCKLISSATASSEKQDDAEEQDNSCNSHPISVDDWLVQMFLDSDIKIKKYSLMDWLVECMKYIMAERDIEDEEEQDTDSDSERSDRDEDEPMEMKNEDEDNEEKKWLVDEFKQLNQLYDKWSEEPFFSFVAQNEELKKFLKTLFKFFHDRIETREQLVNSYRIYSLSLNLEIVSYILSCAPIFNGSHDKKMEKLFVRVPSFFYDDDAQVLALEFIRDELLVQGREKYKSVDDVWKNRPLTVALYTVLNTEQLTAIVTQLPSYLFPVHGTIDDSFSSLIHLILVYHGLNFDSAIQKANKTDVRQFMTQGLESKDVDRRMLCIRIIDKLSRSVFVEMFDGLKPILWSVAMKLTNSEEQRQLSETLELQARRALQKDPIFAQIIIQFIFDLAFEFRESSDLAFPVVLSRVMSDKNAKLESDKLSEYVRSLTITLENREKGYLSNRRENSRNNFVEAISAISLVLDKADSIAIESLNGLQRVVYRCLSVRDSTIRKISWTLYSRLIQNQVLGGMETTHQKNSSSKHMSLFHYTFSLICKRPLEAFKIKAGRKLLLQQYQDQTREELELFHDQLLPLYLQKISKGFASQDTLLTEESFLSLGLLYCTAPSLIRSSTSFPAQEFLDYLEYDYLNISDSKPTYVACWLTYLELRCDHISLSSENQVRLILDELYETDVYQTNQQILQPLVSRLLVAGCCKHRKRN